MRANAEDLVGLAPDALRFDEEMQAELTTLAREVLARADVQTKVVVGRGLITAVLGRSDEVSSTERDLIGATAQDIGMSVLTHGLPEVELAMRFGALVPLVDEPIEPPTLPEFATGFPATSAEMLGGMLGEVFSKMTSENDDLSGPPDTTTLASARRVRESLTDAQAVQPVAGITNAYYETPGFAAPPNFGKPRV